MLFPILLFGIMQQFKDLGALLVFEYSSQFKPAIAFSHCFHCRMIAQHHELNVRIV